MATKKKAIPPKEDPLKPDLASFGVGVIVATLLCWGFSFFEKKVVVRALIHQDVAGYETLRKEFNWTRDDLDSVRVCANIAQLTPGPPMCFCTVSDN